MNSVIRRRSFLWRLAFAPAVLLILLAAGAAESPEGSDLRLVVIVTRHGVRSPLASNEDLDRYSVQPWPRWSVPIGALTAHGNEAMMLMGKYYRALYVRRGLLAGRSEDDQARIFFRADNDQRTIATARALAAALIPGAQVEVDALPPGKIDPLFRPAQVPVGHPDKALGAAAVLGRSGGDLTRIDEACAPALAALRRVLYGGDGTPPPGRSDPLSEPTTVVPGSGDHTVSLAGALDVAEKLVDALELEYAEGLPMEDVGWGRMSPAVLTEVLRLHAMQFNLASGTFYPAQVQGSNLLDHILHTLEQAASEKMQPGALGTLQDRLVVVVGHDTNIINLGGMLGLDWRLPGAQLNPVLPGGALVFELRRHRGDGRFFVRTFYLSQTLAQTRTLAPLTLENPPALAPIFIPGCSEAGPGFDAALERFSAVARHVIDPAFVVSGKP